MTAERTPTHCPHCGAQTAFGSLGRWPRKITRTRAGVTNDFKQTWFHYHCSECGNETAMLESEERIDD